MLRRQQDGAGKNAIGWRLKIPRRLASSVSHGIRLIVFMNEEADASLAGPYNCAGPPKAAAM
jgi:hypothetical protein